MKPLWLLLLLSSLAGLGQAEGSDPALPAPLPLTFTEPVRGKNFPLLAAFDRDPAARKAIVGDPQLAALATARAGALNDALRTCDLETECYANAMRFSEAQIASAAQALSKLYQQSSAVRALTDGPLRASGLYVRHHSLPGGELLAKAWTECATGVNRLIDVYGTAKLALYPEIDAMVYDPKTGYFPRVVKTMALFLQERASLHETFYGLSERFGLELLILNHRDEAGRFEPMEQGENRAAVAKVKSIDWKRYPYSAIVVPGAGSEKAGIALSAAGKLRDEIAAERWREGKAPFVLVSGGYVHPPRTEYAEAVEMKRDLMSRLGVPEEAILIDPHARHTTTNMRNAARLIYRYGLPFGKKALATTDPGQSQAIESAGFVARCTKELGYLPYSGIVRLTPFDLEFLPRIESLHADPLSPLDP